MSPRRDRLSLRLRRPADAGFTVIEIMVALTIIALVAAASVPLLIAGARAGMSAKLSTQAKDLAQQRIEAMRDMQFHVDRQNGPFVDMLDVYYTNVSTTPVTQTRAGETLKGQWVASGGVAPEPTNGPFYKVLVPQVAANPAFSQEIDTQFLDTGGNVLAASNFPSYDSQTSGKDSPPSQLVGVTVITSWSDHGQTHSFATYSRITDTRGGASSITSEGRADVLRVTSSGPSGNALSVDLGLAEADGSQTTGSTASADVKAVYALDAAGSTYVGASGVVNSPSGGTSVNSPVSQVASGSGCGWVSARQTSVANITAGTTSGLPQVPANVDTASPPVNQATARLNLGGSSQPCGSFSFSNQSTSYSSNLQLNTVYPLVSITDDNSQGTVGATGSAWVNATTAATSPHSVTAGANASTSRAIRLFPGLPFVDPTCTSNCNRGLVNITLTSSTLACSSTVTSGSGATPSASGSYSATVQYWTTAGWVTKTISWTSSSAASSDPLAAIDPSTVVVYQNGSNVLHLSDYIASWSTARAITESATSGLHQLSGIVAVTTKPVRDGDPLSALNLQVGNLSCVADDGR